MKSFQETNLLSCGSDLLEGFVLDILSPEGEKENGGFGRLSLQVTYVASSCLILAGTQSHGYLHAKFVLKLQVFDGWMNRQY